MGKPHHDLFIHSTTVFECVLGCGHMEFGGVRKLRLFAFFTNSESDHLEVLESGKDTYIVLEELWVSKRGCCERGWFDLLVEYLYTDNKSRGLHMH